jgi:hypothetical protein
MTRRIPFSRALIPVLVCLVLKGGAAPEAIIHDREHSSEVLGEKRNYRIFLPPDYETSDKRYPVIYWFHGWGERFNQPTRERTDGNYDSGTDYGGDNIANFVATHDVIVVKWDGYNPRQPGEKYPRPYNISPVETDRQFPLYFPELVSYIDANYRTVADRDHRATAGLSMGGFMSFWVSGKYPDLVSSASNFMGSSEFYVGPRGFDVEYRHEEMRNNYEGMRTRLVTGSRDFIRFYHRQMNAVWLYTRPRHETTEFDFDHGTPGMAKTLDFHMRAFASPLPVPEVWSHNDVYPTFSVWGWDVASQRRQPGITALENVSAAGFRSSIREWLPAGRLMPQVKLWISSAKLYPPRKPQPVTSIRLRDGQVRHTSLTADADGRLSFALDGDEYEIGIGSAPVLAIAGWKLEGGAWATAGKPVRVSVRLQNKGGSAFRPTALHWETPNPGVQIQDAAFNVPAVAPGRTIEVWLEFTVKDEDRLIAKFFVANRSVRIPLEIPLYPPATDETNFRIADGTALKLYQHAVRKSDLVLGDGNGDGIANPGERVAIVFPDGDAFRAAELFTNDAFVDNATRVSDDWSDYDHVGASAKYSLPLIAAQCPPGHVVRMLARFLQPDAPEHKIRYAAVEFAVKPGKARQTKPVSGKRKGKNVAAR